jgi:hypothetical protein
MTVTKLSSRGRAFGESEVGFVYDGQMVSAANALHLPVNCMINMRMHHQFWQNFYNRWWNDMNIIADKNGYPEMIGGEVWFGKLADTLAQWYVNPDVRFQMIESFDMFIQEAMSYKPIDRTVVKTRDLILADGEAYNQYQDPMHVVAKHIMKDL